MACPTSHSIMLCLRTSQTVPPQVLQWQQKEPHQPLHIWGPSPEKKGSNLPVTLLYYIDFLFSFFALYFKICLQLFKYKNKVFQIFKN